MASPLRADSPLANVRPSVAVRNGLRLLVTGACKTKREASTAVGLHPNYLGMLTNPNGGSEHVKALLAQYEEQLHDKTLDLSRITQYLGRKALITVGALMDHSQNERIILDSAKELLDRSPETQKSQTLRVDSFSLDGQDVAALISALAESTNVAQLHAGAKDGLVEVVIDNPTSSPEAQAMPLQREKADEVKP